MKKPALPFKISQSFMNDAFITESDLPKDVALPQWCPRYLKYKYVDGIKTDPTDAMLNGLYFEWHLLGATRGGKEPILPRIGVKDQRPPKSAAKTKMIDYLLSKKMIVPNTATTEELFNLIQKMPVDLSAGEPSTNKTKLDQIIKLAKTILPMMGLDPEKGDKQINLFTDEKSGNIDWLTNDIENPERKAIYDVKYTETKQDDWRNGWGDITTKEDAKVQASHYTMLYKEKHGEWVPFYFLIFGKDGWIKIIKMVMTETGLTVYNIAFSRAKELLEKFVKSDWKARPAFNRCLDCPFSEVCDQRALLPQVEEFFL